MTRKSQPKQPLQVDTLNHQDATRVNIPSAENQPIVDDSILAPKKLRYPRNVDLDPQLVWRGKDAQDESDFEVTAPPLYIQERIHPKVLIDELRALTDASRPATPQQVDLFADFNGLPSGDARTEFYQHEQHWSNRMILGDSLQVMASLAEREQLRGKVQCIYFDPPYGIKFNSNFQWSTTSRDVKDGNAAHITREPEQVKAFRDTWRDGIHSYLTYLRDRLTVARDLLTESGSIFVQIGDENVHRVRALMDEVFGEGNFVSQITVQKTSYQETNYLANVADHIVWYCKKKDSTKIRQLYFDKQDGDSIKLYKYAMTPTGEILPINKSTELDKNTKVFKISDLTSPGRSEIGSAPIYFRGKSYDLRGNLHWKTNSTGMSRLIKNDRVVVSGNSLAFAKFLQDFTHSPINNIWSDTLTGSFAAPRIYVVQTITKVIERCILMATDPGDLVLDPTCGSGTTAYVAEQWGRRWITIDTSRVALALARARLMGARYPYYLLADSADGQRKEADLSGKPPASAATTGNIRYGFVYERVPHITLKAIANNAEIDIIYDKWQQRLEPLRTQLNIALSTSWEEWQIPREADAKWSEATRQLHTQWWQGRIARQKEIDDSIARNADYEYLYDKPYSDNKRVRVAGLFTVESVSPYRMISSTNAEYLGVAEPRARYDVEGFITRIINQLKLSGIQQIDQKNRIQFTSIDLLPQGQALCAVGAYEDEGQSRKAGILIGSEYGTLSRQDIVEAAHEAADARYDILVTCAFSFEPHASDFNKLGKLPILRARMNADLHMTDLSEKSRGNLFVVFGDPDIDVKLIDYDKYQVVVKGIDIFKPQNGEIVNNSVEDIACWFLDDNYNGESFFVRHAYFIGMEAPYKALRTTLKGEINEEAWESIQGNTSHVFPKPSTGKIAIKVINHLGDEVMAVKEIR
jgi:adenine-specific DNA-methyltransferase